MQAVRDDGLFRNPSPSEATNVTEDPIRRLAFPLGLVDVKVRAVDDIWSGLKLVVRKELRQRAR
jgi:hypothetical protein